MAKNLIDFVGSLPPAERKQLQEALTAMEASDDARRAIDAHLRAIDATEDRIIAAKYRRELRATIDNVSPQQAMAILALSRAQVDEITQDMALMQDLKKEQKVPALALLPAPAKKS